MPLIAELKEDHRKIKALIEEIKAKSLVTEEGRNLLLQLKGSACGSPGPGRQGTLPCSQGP